MISRPSINYLNRCRHQRVCFKRPITTWNESEVLIDRKSRFQGRCLAISDSKEIPLILDNLISSNKLISRASHPTMYAWRTGRLKEDPSNIKQKQVKGRKNVSSSASVNSESHNVKDYINVQQGWHDGGESGAGQKILSLLESCKLVNVLVIVTRWYGGSPLGSSRFRHISVVSVETLRNGAFLPTGK